jgi:pimeloyl-ACP methyl ester carboxylesterase
MIKQSAASPTTGTEVYLVTGRGGSLERGLGGYLASKYGSLRGVALSAEWLTQKYEDQISAVARCICDAESTQAPLIANSYGAYLVLIALMERPPINTSVLLLSPVLGATVGSGTYFRPPDARRFSLAISGFLPKPRWLGICIGEKDTGYMPDVWERLIGSLRPDHHCVFENEGHGLSMGLVEELVTSLVAAHTSRITRSTG